MKTPNVILITGASSGIGAALAQHYAGPDRILLLTGRNPDRLATVVSSCRQTGAVVDGQVVDVADRQAMADLLTSWDDQHEIDLIIANAGIDGAAFSGAEVYYQVLQVNLTGVLNTIMPLLPAMIARKRGQIALISSLAGFRGMASAVAYATSKNAVKALAEGLRGRHGGDGVEISAVCPGFVTTRITANNNFPMPFIWPADKAARYIAAKLQRNQGRIAFPWPLHFAVWLLAALPASWADSLLKRAPRKQ